MSNSQSIGQQKHEEALEAYKQFVNRYQEEIEEEGIVLEEGSLIAAQSRDISIAGITAKTDVWGITIILDNNATTTIIKGTSSIGTALTKVLEVIGSPVAGLTTVLGAGLGLALKFKITQMQLINMGKGVHFPITWLQMATLISAAPSGPAAVSTAAIAALHPISN